MAVAAECDVSVRNGVRSIPLPEGLRSADLEDRPASGVVVTAFAMRTPFGGTEQTLEARRNGDSAITEFKGPTGGKDPRVAARLNFNALKELNLGSESKWYSENAALELLVLIDAFSRAGLLGQDGRIVPEIDPYRGAIFGYSGVGQGLGYVDLREKKKGMEIIKPSDLFKALTDQPNLRVAERLGIRGRAQFGSAACATGLYAIENLYSNIMRGKISYGAAGGVETLFDTDSHSEQAFVCFDAIKALTRNPDPNTASRPLDLHRNGFVMGEGAGFLILESIEHARARNARILAVIEGAETSIDGDDIAKANSVRVSRHMVKTLMGRDGRLVLPDVTYGHLTSTKEGDSREMEAWRLTAREHASKTAWVANKAALGHSMGAAGAVSACEAVDALERGIIAPTIHLVTPDPEFDGLDIVTRTREESSPRTAVIWANGLGGQNGGLLLRKWEE